ncbi:hypothetical protein PAXRUDRAFT_776560, partial [Paxillus rubicundulus Ve08.2h10]
MSTLSSYFCRRGADVNVQDNESWTPLHFACAWGHNNIIELLLQEGADKNAQDSDSDTPLHFSSMEGYLDVTKLHLEGADPYTQ